MRRALEWNSPTKSNTVPTDIAHILSRQAVSLGICTLIVQQPRLVIGGLLEPHLKLATSIMRWTMPVLDSSTADSYGSETRDGGAGPDLPGNNAVNLLGRAAQLASHLSLPFCRIQFFLFFNQAANGPDPTEAGHWRQLIHEFLRQVHQQGNLASDILLDLIEPLGDGLPGQVS